MNEAKPVRFRLSDGSFAKITYAALRDLKRQRDVVSGRIKKGAGGNEAVYVIVEKAIGSGTVELALRDVLGAFHYRIPVEHASQKYVLLDGDARNLLPSNIGLTERKDKPFAVERAPRKVQKPKPRPDGAMATERQIELLLEMNENREFHLEPSEEDGTLGSQRHCAATEHNVLVVMGVKLFGADRLPLIREIVQELIVDLYGQIDRGVYTGIDGAHGKEEHRIHFCTWVKKAATTQFNARIFGKGDVERQPICTKLQDEYIAERDRYGRRIAPHAGSDEQLSTPSRFLRQERKADGTALDDLPQKFPAKKKKAA